MRIGVMRGLAVGLAVTTLLVACGGNDDDGGGGTDTAQGSTAESPAATVQIADSDLGSILVDDEGMTLYLFEADTSDVSTCYGECADVWPALIDDAATAGEGADDSLLGTTERKDGEMQVTYADHPLYHFASDQAPGDTQGQNVSEVWFVVDASGSPITDKAREGDGY